MLGRAGGAVFLLAALASAAREAPLHVVATIEPLCMLAREVGGGRVACTALVPAGASPHAFEPRPSALAAVARADLLLRAGNGIDDWAAPLAGAGEGTWSSLGPACARDDASCAHFWLAPQRASAAIARVGSLLGSRAEASAEIGANASRLRSELSGIGLAGEGEGLAGVSFVAFHPAWGEFASSFGLIDLGAIQSHGAEEPTPRQLAELIAAARDAGARIVLVEAQQSPHTARIVAEELGARLVTVDPLGDPRDPQRSTAAGLIRWNARQIAAALAEPTP